MFSKPASPEDRGTDGWCFPTGDCRVSIGYGFMIGPGGEFGIDANQWTPLHTSTQPHGQSSFWGHSSRCSAETISEFR